MFSYASVCAVFSLRNRRIGIYRDCVSWEHFHAVQGFYGGGGIVSYEGDISSPILEAAWFAGEGWRERYAFFPLSPGCHLALRVSGPSAF